MNKNGTKKRTFLSAPYLVWMIGFIIIPLWIIIQYALTDMDGGFTLSNVLAMFDSIHLKALIFSVEIALLCTVICIAIAYPLVMVLKRLNLGRKGFVFFILVLPMWMNFILRILAWQMILSSNGILNLLLTKIGLQPLAIANTWVAILIGVVYDYLPYMVLPIYNSIMEIDGDVIEAARDLGAGARGVFGRVIFPLSVPGLMSGIVMVFVPSMTSFVVSDILGGGKLQLIGNIIEQEFITSMDWHLGSGLSVMLMIFVLISTAFTMKNDTDGRSSAIW